jgi:hypothetical protein
MYGGMKMKAILISIIMFFVFYSIGFAQTLEERIKILEEALKKQEQTIKEQQKLIEDLKAEMKQVKPEQQVVAQPKETLPPASPVAATPSQAMTPEQMQQQVQELNEKVNEVVEAQKKNVLSVFNPAIGLVGETILSYRSQGKKETGSDRPGGFDIFQRSVELNLAGSVDPFARGYAVINASVDPITGEASATVEEAAIQTTSLPWNLTLKGGRFFGEFGRLSYIHDHELPFVNRPLALDKYVGGESKTDGLQINYLLPIPHYVSLTAGVGDQFGDTPNNVGNFRHFNELNFWGRSSTYFDLTPDVSLETGISSLFNPKTQDRGGVFVPPDGSTFTERRRLVVGGDLVLAYRPLRNNQFRSLTWGTELLYSDNRYLVHPAAIPGSPMLTRPDFNRSVGSFGLYSYLAYKFHRQWTAGFLFESVENPQDNHAQTFAYSPYITWALSHWNQLRLQYTHTANNATTGLRDDDAIYLQWSWIIGSHSHGWQER